MSKQLTVFPRPTVPTMTTMTTVPAMAGERSPAVTISSEILVAAIVFLFMVVVFVFFLYLYARRYLGPNPLLRRGRSGTRLVFAADLGAAPARRGLDPAALAALPVVVVGRRGGGGAGKEGKEEEEEEALECAVCLCEVAEGEEARLLPKCNHGFHVECIDMWLHSHSTCPLCRSPVVGGGGFAEFSPSPAAESARAPAPEPAEPPIFPTNVLFWGTQDRINAGNSPSSSEAASSSSSSSRTRELVIEIPRRAMGGSPSPISPLPVSRMSAEEMKSPPPPSSARLRSLRRLLSRGKQAMGSSCSPRGGDIEQGSIGGAATPRTPTS